jgi:hypothetical protein
MANDLPEDIGNLPLVLGPAGLLPQSPLALLQQLLTLVSKTNPGYTANLPGSLVEDISSTDVAALSLIDQLRVEMLNSLTPRGANAFVLNQLGQIYGVQVGSSSNTSVFLVFTGLPGYVIAKGFTVTDGNYQYSLIDGGVIGSGGQSQPLFAVATQPGIWAIPAGTITGLVTGVPQGFSLSVVNPEPGIPGTDSETITSYRARVLMAGLAASQGMARYLRTLLSNVPGVQPRLIGIQQQTDGDWMIVVGGGDPYEVAYAIYMALFDINNLVGSELSVVDISHANPAAVTTDLDHLYPAGAPITLDGVNPDDYDGDYAVLAVTGNRSFTLGIPYAANGITSLTWAGGTATAQTTGPHGVIPGSAFTIQNCLPDAWNGVGLVATAGTTGDLLKWAVAADPGAATQFGQLAAGISNFDATALPAYGTGGVITPSQRNIVVTLTDFPDNYQVPFVIPPQQTMAILVQWSTTSPNYVSPAAVAQLSIPAMVQFINNIPVGKPVNLYQLQDVFADAVESVLPSPLISFIDIHISINGVGTPVTPGTGLVEGDPQSYFFVSQGDFSVVQIGF